MLVTTFCVAGLLTFPICIWAWLANCRLGVVSKPARWNQIWRWSWVAGLALAIVSMFVCYPVDGGNDRFWIFGVPFMTHAVDSNGFDYVSCLSLPAVALNFVFWCFFPQLVLRVWA